MPTERVTGRLAKLREAKNATGTVLPAVKELLVKKSFQPSGRRTDCLHPSEMSHSDWCPRATYLRITGQPTPKEIIPFTLENIFAEGNAIHDKWQSWLAETGDLWGDWECASCGSRSIRHKSSDLVETGSLAFGGSCNHVWKYNEVSLYHDELNIYGHEDGALLSKNCLVEFKSVGLGTLRREQPNLLSNNYLTVNGRGIYDLDTVWKQLHRPFMTHVRQVNIYLWLAQEMGLPFDRCAVVYEYKVNQQVKEFEVKLNMDIMRPLIVKADDIRAALDRGLPPACPAGEDGCKYCASPE